VRFAIQILRATQVDLFLSKKTDLSNRLATLENFKIWLEYITNFFQFGDKIEKR
jgi:hypothetical protein